MSYELALAKAYLEIEDLTEEKKFMVKFLADEYEVDLENKRVLSLACNVLTEDYLSILILHYLIRKIKGLAPLKGEWVSFQELPGGGGYFPSFRKRVIEPILRKYKDNPLALYDVLKRFPGKKADFPDLSIIIEVFENVPFLITLQKPDEEFPAEANLLFDKNIEDIFPTEDVVVLGEFLAKLI